MNCAIIPRWIFLRLTVARASVTFTRIILIEAGVVVAPGAYFGDAGEGYVRFALVPTEADCARAVERLEEAL